MFTFVRSTMWIINPLATAEKSPRQHSPPVGNHCMHLQTYWEPLTYISLGQFTHHSPSINSHLFNHQVSQSPLSHFPWGGEKTESSHSSQQTFIHQPAGCKPLLRELLMADTVAEGSGVVMLTARWKQLLVGGLMLRSTQLLPHRTLQTTASLGTQSA